MPLHEMIGNLLSVRPGKKSFLSIYLDLTPEGRGKKRVPLFLKKHLPELIKTLPVHSREQASLARDLKRVRKYLEDDLEPAWKGIALFACAPEDLFLAVPLPLPPANAVSLSSHPHLFSLAQQARLYEPYAVLVADSRQARLFVLQKGRVEKQITLFWEDRHTTRFGRMGLSLQKFQRHIQEHVKQRAKETVENLGKLINRGKIEYLFLSAEEGMEGEIQRQLPPDWKGKKVSLTSLDTHDPDHKILSGAMEALQTISREKAEALASEIIEEAQPLGRATLGAEPTLSALQNHQMERLVLDSRFKATGWQCQGCGYLGMGGVPQSCPLCQNPCHPAELREEVVWRAQSPEIEILFSEDFAPLLKAGGIGALLKFRISRAKSR